jgi:hypothetical protein
MNLAQQLDASGDAKGALREMLSAVALLRKTSAKSSAVPRDFGVALRAAGEILTRLDRRDEARANLEESKAVLQALVREHPGEAIYTDELRITMDAFGLLDAL